MTVTSFRDLHNKGTPFLLPNAWDVGSALAFAEAGFPAIATTSFGVAASSGMPDGDRSSRAATLALVAQLCRLPVHITADIEDGYSDDPGEVAALVAELVAKGLVGINLEDSRTGRLVDVAAVAEKIAAVKRRNPAVFLNARVDSFWFGEDATVAAVLARAHTYQDAGADGIFVPGISAPGDIRSLTAGTDLPVNLLAHATLSVAELGDLGVRRVSSGSLPYRASVDAAVDIVIALRDGKPLPETTSYAAMQARLTAFQTSAGGHEDPLTAA